MEFAAILQHTNVNCVVVKQSQFPYVGVCNYSTAVSVLLFAIPNKLADSA